MNIVYKTTYGKAIWDNSFKVLKEISDNSIDLVITSPPFALRRKKAYGNVSAEEYCEWFFPFAKEIHRVIKKKGSFVLDIGGSWNKGEPTRNLYHFELLVELCKKWDLFKLAQEFYWFNPAKMPSPAQWVTIERIRVKDSVNPIWWLCKTNAPKASNKNVLIPYSKSMISLLKNGYNSGVRPSGHNVSENWGKKQKGAIPTNLIIAANTQSSDNYLKACKKFNIKIHPARFARPIPEFFIKFLTKKNDIVLDPFSGSNIVGEVAEKLKRKWISIEIDLEYIIGSAFRFENIGEKTYQKNFDLNKSNNKKLE